MYFLSMFYYVLISIILVQDHNKDFIVDFPDFSPFLRDPQIKKEDLHKIITLKNNHRFSFRETNSKFPEPHLWYSTKEVINALKLFLDAGNDLQGSLTFRYNHHFIQNTFSIYCLLLPFYFLILFFTLS